MRAIPPFSSSDLETISRWIDEVGEVFVSVGYSHSASSDDKFLVRSMDQFVALVEAAPAQRPHPYSSGHLYFDVYRGPILPFRGPAGSQLAERVCSELPDGDDFLVVDPSVTYPSEIEYLTDGGDSHGELRSQLRRLEGREVAVGPFPGDMSNDTWDRQHPGSTIRRDFQRP